VTDLDMPWLERLREYRKCEDHECDSGTVEYYDPINERELGYAGPGYTAFRCDVCGECESVLWHKNTTIH